MSLQGVAVGDDVVVVDACQGADWRVLSVDAVGHKFVTVGGKKYEIETGRRTGANRYAMAYTKAQWERRGVEAMLRDAIADVADRRAFAHLSVDDMRQLAAELMGVAKRLESAPKGEKL